VTPELNRIYQGDCLATLRSWPDAFVNTCVTSPPYFGLRDYGVDGQIGLEDSPAAFVAAMVEVFREVRRLLRDDGTLWLNLGDSYAGSWGAQSKRESSTNSDRLSRNQIENHPRRSANTGTIKTAGVKPKDLYGIPWMVAFALRSDGWYLRQDNIWNKPNPMPESVTDRCTKAHEYLFLLAKSERYYFDQEAIAEPVTTTIERMSQDIESQAGSDRVPGKTNGPMKAVLKRSGNKERKAASERGVPVASNGSTNGAVAGSIPWEGSTRNKRSVWTVTTKPCPEAEGHFATFPPDLIAPCVLAGSPRGG
jgi:DNA modification methylase